MSPFGTKYLHPIEFSFVDLDFIYIHINENLRDHTISPSSPALRSNERSFQTLPLSERVNTNNEVLLTSIMPTYEGQPSPFNQNNVLV